MENALIPPKHRLIKAILFALLGGLILTAWLVSTEAGLRFLVTQAQRWVPGELQIARWQGRLIDNFSFTGLSYQSPNLTLQIAAFQFAWEAQALFKAQIHIKQLQVSQVVISLPQSQPRESTSRPLSLPDLTLPVQLALDDVKILHVTIKSANHPPIQIDSFTLRSTTTHQLSLHDCQISSPQLTAHLTGNIELIKPHRVQLHFNWSAALPNFPPITGQGELTGNEQRLVLAHRIDKPDLKLNVTIDDILGNLHWQGQLNWQQIQWPLADPSPLIHSQQGQLTTTGSLADYQLQLTTQLQGQQLPKGQWRLTAQGNQNELSFKQLRAEFPKGELTAHGQLAWRPQLAMQLDLRTKNLALPMGVTINSHLLASLQGDSWQLEVRLPTNTQLSLQAKGFPQLQMAKLTWQNVQWPLAGQALLQSSQGRAELSGNLPNYRLEIHSHLAGLQLPSGQWHLSGRGNYHQLELTQLKAELLTGTLTGQGQVAWQPQLRAQLNLQANQLNLKELWQPWPAVLKIDSQLVAHLTGRHFEINHLTLTIPHTQTHLALQGQGSLSDPPTFETTLTWQGVRWPLVNPALVNSPQGQLSLAGTLQDYRLNLTSELSGPQIPQQQLQIAGRGNLQQFTLASLRNQLLQGWVTATGQLRWQPQVTAQLQLKAEKLIPTELLTSWPADLPLHSQLQASLENNRWQVNHQITLPKTTFSLQGNGNLANQTFETVTSWQNIQWPLASKEPLVKSDQGQFRLDGSVQHYQFRLETAIGGQNLPKSHWQALGKGNLNGLQLTNLQGQLLQGTLELIGQVTWQPALVWELSLQGDHLNLGQHWVAWPGQLALTAHSQGKLQNGHLNTHLEINQLQGTLRNYPLNFQTQLTIQDQQYLIKKFDFRSGKAYLTAAGELGGSSKLHWELKIPELAIFLPAAKGSLTSQGEVNGPLTDPHLVANLSGQSLAIQANQLNNFQAKLNLEGRSKTQLEIVATGFTSPQDRLMLKLQGGLHQNRWVGQLQQFTVSTPKVGTWQLPKPVSLQLASNEVQVTDFCLTHTSSVVCAQWHWQPHADSLVQLRLEQVPLNVFAPSITEMSGILEGRLTASLNSQGGLSSQTSFTLSPGFVKLADEAFTYQGGHLQWQINSNGFNSHFNLKVLKQSSLKGEINLPNLTHFPLAEDLHLQGQLIGQFEDLEILPRLIPQVENTHGRVNFEVKLGGSLKTPQFQGQLHLQNAATELPELGLTLKNLNVLIKDDGNNHLQMQAQANSGKGSLSVQGTAKSRDLQAHLAITGNHFEAINTPLAWATLSPDLHVQMGSAGISVTGKLTIPEALITPTKAASGAVTLSKDVVIIHPQKPSPPPKEPPKLPISSDITLILGDKVVFKGAGFKSRITGSLRASNQPHKLTVGSGELKLVEGTYKAYGQNLKVERGRVIFAGGPIDNPGLDIRAFRRTPRKGEEEVVAGVAIQGTAQSPEISLYSIPSLDQSNMLSYIMFGKPIAQASEAEGKALLGAAIASQLEGEGEPLTQRIAQQFGLDEASIASEGGVEESALVLGKYLSPNLYIGYGVGLFDASTVFRLRYFLSKRLTLETETGTQSGVDLRYSFER